MPFDPDRRQRLFSRGVALGAGMACPALLGAGQQEETPQLHQPLDLIELMNTPVEVASKRPESIRETAGAVTVLTREEILQSGARDLLGALEMLPGFQANSFSNGHVGAGIRGLSGNDGKVLILVDGLEFNDTNLGVVALGNHIPVDQISRIEIIRGPGSVIYGGFAGLAVVRVTTRNAAELHGVSGSVHLGQTGTRTTTRDYSAAYGHQWSDLALSLAFSGGTALRGLGHTLSTQLETQALVDVDMGRRSELRQGFLDLGLHWKGTSLRFIRDLFERGRLVAPGAMEDHGTFLSLNQVWKPTDSLSLQPSFTYREQSSFDFPSQLNPTQGRRFRRTQAGLQAQYSPSPAWSILAGAEGWEDTGITDESSHPWFSASGPRVSYRTLAQFIQVAWTVQDWTATLGGRYERHSQAGGSFVPRIALTRTWETQHFKFLAAKAFRTPTIWNLDTNPGIKPEHIRTFELEYGFQISDQAYLTLNAFDTRVLDNITYLPISSPPFIIIVNGGDLGTRGLEAELRFQGAYGDMRLSVEAHRATAREVQDYQVPGHPDYLVGVANLKFTMQANLRLAPHWFLCPSVVALGPRYTMEATRGIQPRDSSTQINLVLNGDWPKQGLKASIGTRNITGADMGLPVPQSSLVNETLPTLGRELFLRLGYNY
ncbi:MAG: TonB-dependent receptor [Holophagaceae bacterium]|nr:TonB-dependent receptor [Holophagaceae bacterium]